MASDWRDRLVRWAWKTIPGAVYDFRSSVLFAGGKRKNSELEEILET
jgi:hypothetical protein